MKRRYHRHSAVIRARRQWQVVRHQAKRRDNFRCVGVLPGGRVCGARGRLEVDHIKPVRTHPQLAYELSNLQTLCVPCHSRKTRLEVGLGKESPARAAWRDLVHALSKPRKEGQCLSQ